MYNYTYIYTYKITFLLVLIEYYRFCNFRQYGLLKTMWVESEKNYIFISQAFSLARLC